MSTVTTPNLGNIIASALIRKIVYGTYAVGSLVIGGIAIYDVTTFGSLPGWVGGAQAVVAYLAIPIGGLALANSPSTTPAPVSNVTNILTTPTGDSTNTK